MLLVTHEMAFAADVADTVAVMVDGGIAEAGPAREVLSHPRSERVRTFLNRVLRPGVEGIDKPAEGGSAAPLEEPSR